MAKKLQLRRGTTSQHSSFTGAVGEVTVDTDKKVVVVHDGSTAGGVPLAKAADVAAVLDEDDMSTDSATRPPSQQSVKAYAQPLDADLTSLAGCQSGAAGALAALTQTEVEILDGATLSTTELNYVDGVTSAIQTQLNAKGTSNLALTGDNTWTGSQRGEVSDVGTKTANFDFDLDTSNNFKVTIGANDKEFGFSNIDAGQSGTIEVVNGAYTLKYGSEIHFPGGTPPVLTQSATSFLAYYCPSDSVVIVQNILNVKAQS